MAEAKKPPLQGKKKGGAVYPRLSLKDAVEYARKLVSKTHTGAQPYSTIFPGVFGVNPNNTIGAVRASALKQYGLLQGKPQAYEASELAKKIAAAPAEEQPPLLREALLKPRIFRVLFNTFQGDSVSLAKLKQQSSSSDVHPDSAENCAQLFIDSAKFAHAALPENDGIKLLPSPEAISLEPSEPGENGDDEGPAEATGLAAQKPDKAGDVTLEKPASLSGPEYHPPSSRSVIQVNVTLDSSLDTDKLERQLALLRRYGAI